MRNTTCQVSTDRTENISFLDICSMLGYMHAKPWTTCCISPFLIFEKASSQVSATQIFTETAHPTVSCKTSSNIRSYGCFIGLFYYYGQRTTHTWRDVPDLDPHMNWLAKTRQRYLYSHSPSLLRRPSGNHCSLWHHIKTPKSCWRLRQLVTDNSKCSIVLQKVQHFSNCSVPTPALGGTPLSFGRGRLVNGLASWHFENSNI